MSRPLCILESPYAAKTPAEVGRNLRFARCVARSLVREGFNPFASHLFYTQFLDDTVPEERKLGITLGLEWGQSSRVTHAIFALRPGEKMSKGMTLGLAQWQMLDKIVLVRTYLQTGELQAELPLEEAR